jgi:hypothetical protein
VYTGPKAKEEGKFSVRAMCVHRDKVTGADRLFLSIGKRGIFSGVFDPAAPGKVKWSAARETGPVETRPLAIAEANGDLVFSSGRKIYRRIDGDKPSYQVIADLSGIYPNVIASPTGGARGLTHRQPSRQRPIPPDRVRDTNGATRSASFFVLCF